jgi:hypothetical protein
MMCGKKAQMGGCLMVGDGNGMASWEFAAERKLGWGKGWAGKYHVHLLVSLFGEVIEVMEGSSEGATCESFGE